MEEIYFHCRSVEQEVKCTMCNMYIMRKAFGSHWHLKMCEFMTPGVWFAQRMSPEAAALKRTPPQSEGSVQCQCDDTLEKVALGTPHTPVLSLLTLEWVKYSETSSKKPVAPPPWVPSSLVSPPAGWLGQWAVQTSPPRSLPGLSLVMVKLPCTAKV